MQDEAAGTCVVQRQQLLDEQSRLDGQIGCAQHHDHWRIQAQHRVGANRQQERAARIEQAQRIVECHLGASRDVYLGARREIQPAVHECQRVGQIERIGARQHDGPRTERHAGVDQGEGLIDRHVQAAADRANEVHAGSFELGEVGHHGDQLAVGNCQGDLVVKRTGLAVSEHTGR